jgi:hypothetical protein
VTTRDNYYRWAIKATVVLAVLGAAVLALNGIRVAAPRQQRLTNCTTNVLDFSMTCDHWSPYQFLLGVPYSVADDLRFRGEITISQPTGTVARVPVSADAVTWCNWLGHHDLMGYILTWSQTNRGERLEEFLTRGQTYQVRVTFTEMPPAQSSLWLSSIKRVGLLSK